MGWGWGQLGVGGGEAGGGKGGGGGGEVFCLFVVSRGGRRTSTEATASEPGRPDRASLLAEADSAMQRVEISLQNQSIYAGRALSALVRARRPGARAECASERGQECRVGCSAWIGGGGRT